MMCSTPHPSSLRGFSLIELLVTLAVAVILINVAAPGFSGMLASNRLASDYNEVLAGLNYARSEAIKRRETVSFAVASGSTWTYEVKDADAGLLKQRGGKSADVEVTTLSISFDQLGRVDGAACDGGCTVTVSHDAESVGNRTIQVNRFGRVGRG